MERKKQKSLVEKTNSWKPFVNEIQGALQAKDYRKETVCAILRTLDTEVSLWPGSVLRYVGGVIVGSGFLLGRQLLYGSTIKKFLERNHKHFVGSPLPVIKAFNKLMRALFSEKGAKSFLLDESIARRKLTEEEKILKQGKEAEKRLRAYVENTQKRAEGVSLPPPPETLEEERPEFEFKKKKVAFRPGTSLDPRTIEIFEDVAESGIPIDPLLISGVEEAAASFTQFTHNASQALPVSSLGPFAELSQEIKKLSTRLFLDEGEIKLLCSGGDWKKILEEKDRSLRKPYEDIVRRATELKNGIEELSEELDRSKGLFEPFLQKKDAHGRVEVLLNELALLQLEPSLVSEQTAVIEKTLSERKAKVEKVLSLFQKEFYDLLSHLQELEMRADRLKIEIMYARWEIFSRYTPFADLGELVDRVEQDILSTLSEGDDALIVGEKSFEEIRGAMLDSLYTHNVRLVRWELLSRALRLKDIRSAVENELLSLDREMALMRLAGETSQYLSERKWLYSFFTKLLAPYTIFKNTCDPESINVIFRYFWMDLDRFKEEKKARKSTFDTLIAVKALKKTAELMEKISDVKIPIAELETSPFTWLEKYDDEFALLPLIASSPYTEKETFLSQLKKLSERKKEIEKLARAVQAVKTFEPERIEAILESFSLLRFAEEPFGPVEKRLQEIEKILERIEEVVVCELGLLDTKSRMESGYAVDVVREEAKNKLPAAQARIQKNLEKKAAEQSFVGQLASHLQEEEKKTEDIFESARNTALLILQNRLLTAASDPDALARPILLLFLFQRLFSSLSKELPREKTAKLSELFSFSRKFFHLIFPKPLPREMAAFLKEFVHRIRTLSPQNPILTEIETIEKELATTITWNIPVLAFLPGDLRFFLE